MTVHSGSRASRCADITGVPNNDLAFRRRLPRVPGRVDGHSRRFYSALLAAGLLLVAAQVPLAVMPVAWSAGEPTVAAAGAETPAKEQAEETESTKEDKRDDSKEAKKDDSNKSRKPVLRLERQSQGLDFVLGLISSSGRIRR